MIARKTARFIPLAAMAICSLALVLFLTNGRPPDRPSAGAMANGPTRVAVDGIAQSDRAPSGPSPPRSDFGETTARPLFSSTRRPPKPVVKVESKPEPRPEPIVEPEPVELGRFVLRAVLMNGETRTALLAYRSGGATMQVEEAQKIDGWLVVSIEPAEVTLRRGDIVDRIGMTGSVGGH